MKRKLLAFLGVVLTVALGTGVLRPNLAFAAGCSDGFLGFRPWHAGLTTTDSKGKCVVKEPEDGKVAAFVWTIAANVLADLFLGIGYVSVGFVIYGGFLYIMSTGDPGKVAKGKKTLISAIIGLAIGLLANLIINTIMSVLPGV